MTKRARLTCAALLVAWIGSVALVVTRAEPARAATAQAAQVPGAGSAQPPGAGARPARPLDTSMFTHSDNCVACHNNLASASGEDISIGASWRGSMMANSGRDPYFLASVRRETLDHPTHAAEIEDECATCHLPAGQRIAAAAGQKGRALRAANGAALYADADLERLGADGVTCTVCHQIAAERLGTRESFNGNFALTAPLPNGNRRALGPHAPDAGRLRIMHSVTGFEQEQAPHVRQSELCATCHTLTTRALGPDGTVIGSLPEQMNYLEWRHSAFMDEKRSCQSCHMPPVQGPVQIASVLGIDREQLARHTFLGGNAFMLRLLNRYRAELGVDATPAELEATARATVRQLETDTAGITIDRVELSGTTLMLDVAITNLAGHKFPTGYPSRRAWLHVTATSAQGAVLFESGRLADTGRIDGNDSDASPSAFEPHYAEITQSDQVQVYESIMGTAAGAPTTGLLQGTQYLKDNRLLPRGFNKSTAAREIQVVGGASADSDFLGGGDRVRYRVPITATGRVTINVELRYQPIAYRWAQNLATYSAAEPRAFVNYYNSLAASSSVVVGAVSRTIDR